MFYHLLNEEEKGIAVKHTILTAMYPVVARRVSAAEVKTVEGAKVITKTEPGAVMVGENSRWIGADVNATNGILHIFDHVIFPPNLNL